MSVQSQAQLLLTLSHPDWNATSWVSSLPARRLKEVLPSLWKLSCALQKENLVNRLSSEQKKQLKRHLSFFKPQGASKRNHPLKTEALFLVETASLTTSEALGKRIPWTTKKKWLLEWLQKASFQKLTESVLFSDECIDRLLGLLERKVQHKVNNASLPKNYQEEALYLDLSPEDLFTPYRVICRWGNRLKLKPGMQIVDLGSGIGRLPLTLGLLYPQVFFTGIEIMKERHEMAEHARKNLKLKNVQLLCANAAKQGLPKADYYYFFNPFVGHTLRQVFRHLKKQAAFGKFRIAVAQIELPWNYIRRLPWLKCVSEFKADRGWDGIGISVFETISVE